MSGLGKIKNANYFPGFGFENRFWTFINVQNTKVGLELVQKCCFFPFLTIMVSFFIKHKKCCYCKIFVFFSDILCLPRFSNNYILYRVLNGGYYLL